METLIDFSKESIISLGAARDLPQLKRDGRRPDLSAVWRWCQVGILRGGQRVKLESIYQAGRRCTSAEAVDRWLERLNQPATPEGLATRSPHKREADIRRAERDLKAVA